ncbi:Rv3235 family protein [Nocardioides sambongensis]|uniref:Rv3235 family protein n=1 Tax=Nocardioides sambongensis TaxID=2589074 RepID=UPI0018C880E2|nr:Rv3235 family protein [Nocardioides sambongensis]
MSDHHPTPPTPIRRGAASTTGLRAEVPVTETQGALALSLLPRQAPPTVDRDADRARPGATVVPIDVRLRRTIEDWTRRYVQAAVEIVAGDRPATQLVRWTEPEVYADLQRRAHLVARAGGHQPGVRRVQQVRPRIRSVHTCFVTPVIAECSVHLRYGDRGRAVAARFERLGERWICTALDFA